MIERLEHVNASKLDRRLASVGTALDEATLGTVAQSARGAVVDPIPPTARSDGRGRAHVRAGAAARGAYRRKEASLRPRARSRQRPEQAAPHLRTIKRAQDMLGKLHDLQVLQTHVAAVQAEPRTGRPSRRRSRIWSGTSRINAVSCTDATSHLPRRCAKRRLAVRKVIVPQLAHPPRRVAINQDDACRVPPARAPSQGDR